MAELQAIANINDNSADRLAIAKYFGALDEFCNQKIEIFHDKMELETQLRAHIETLTDGLRESLMIVHEREKDFTVLHGEREDFVQKVRSGILSNFPANFFKFAFQIHKLEQRIASLRNANFLNCSRCQNLKSYVNFFKDKFQAFVIERKEMLKEMAGIRWVSQ